ncbi:MAG: MATE family efflux transporter [Lachnospiraceae bacterium]|nr:MATE family efflux transporter [Lachnospiraceae bacterium]
MLKNFRKKFIGTKDFYIYVLGIAVPMIIQNAITNFVSFLDNIMVGQIGTEQMSGVAIANQLIFVFNLCIFGGVSGAGIFGTQFFGKGDYEGQKYTFRFKVYICALLTVIALLLGNFLDTELISLYLNDTGSVGDISLALDYGKHYLAIMLIGLIPFAISQVYINTIRETGHTLIPMIASMIAVFTNLILDYCLIFGAFGLPQMGVRGAALATIIARFIECIIVVVWTHLNPGKNKYIVGAYRSFYIPGNILKDVLKKGTPLMINEMLWSMGMTVIVQCYAIRGLEVVAAQNISSTITNLFNIVYIQLGASIAIVVGQLLGAGKLKEARDADTKMIFFVVTACIGMSVLMSAFGGLFPQIYNTEEAIKELATKFIFISALMMPVCAFCHSTYFTLRSGGKTGVTFIFDSVYTWLIVIPVAYCLSHFTNWSIVPVFFCVQSMEFVKAIIGFFMVKSNVWLNTIVKDS